MEVHSSLAQLRAKRGLSATDLASAVGVTRQTIYAIESGSYVPNTTVGLKLARVLEVKVEDIFRLDDDPQSAGFTVEVQTLPEAASLQPGQPLRLCRVGERVIATSPDPASWSLPHTDAIVLDQARTSKNSLRAQTLESGWKAEQRLLIAGCDPSASVLAQHLKRQGVDLVISCQNSSRALDLLKEGLIHIAGTHLLDEKTGEFNLPKIQKMFGNGSVAVISFAFWEEGIVVAPQNPKNIKSIADLARRNVRIVNREPGAGCRLLLDSFLHRLSIDPRQVKGYEQIAQSHLLAARKVKNGEADCCISTRGAARVFGLDFVPLATKRYDLVIPQSYLHLPPMEALFETLGRASFRRELENVAGYDMRSAGDRLG